MVASERDPIILVSNVRGVQYNEVQIASAPRYENDVNTRNIRHESMLNVHILKNERDSKAIVKSSTSARLLVWGGCLQSVATYASLKTLRLFDASQDLPISAVWARGQHCPPRLFGIELMMRNRLSDRLRLVCKAVSTQHPGRSCCV